MIEYTFEHYCKLHNLNLSDFESPPYSFSEWLNDNEHLLSGDFNPYIVYDGYCYSLELLGYEVFGDSLYGIGVKRS